tara:strand:- start:8561 stop:8929 length:369 start_codon:yes stop_codon:yes gene_type:complete
VRNGHTCFKTHGFDENNYSVKVLQELEFEEKKELYSLEQKYINDYECVNILKTPASHGLSKSESDKIYYENNREEIIRRATNYNKSESAKLYRKNRHIYQSSWGGDRQHNNNLLNIDVNIFI